jgi:hypothetical protein
MSSDPERAVLSILVDLSDQLPADPLKVCRGRFGRDDVADLLTSRVGGLAARASAQQGDEAGPRSQRGSKHDSYGWQEIAIAQRSKL